MGSAPGSPVLLLNSHLCSLGAKALSNSGLETAIISSFFLFFFFSFFIKMLFKLIYRGDIG